MRLGPRLMLSHVLLVILCLVLMSAVSALVITQAERQINLQRALEATQVLAENLRMTPGTAAPDILTRLRRESERMNGRIMLLDARGVVLTDPQGTYVGERIPLASMPRMPRISNARRHTFSDGQEHFVITVQLSDAQKERAKAEILAVAVKVADVDPPWRTIVPLLGGIGVGILILAIAISFAISRSVTRPVADMTRAAEKIALGDYSQHISVNGRDEISQLATAFNSMSAQVAQAQRTQRDFLANVSHDLRTPLTSIQGFSQAILEDAITDREGYKRAAEIIQQESLRMRHLVDDLLELARIESGELSYDSQPVPLAEMIRREVQRHQPRAKTRDVNLDVALAPSLPSIRADGTRLAQIWANLLGNAVRYARQGTSIQIRGGRHLGPKGASAQVSFGEFAASHDYAQISISNLTDDLDPSVLPRLFERFYRGDQSRVHAEGTGLGLSIVRQTVLAHHGVLEAGLEQDMLTISVCLPV